MFGLMKVKREVLKRRPIKLESLNKTYSYMDD